MSDLYSRIHGLCEELGISDAAACKSVQMPRSTLSNLKNGHAQKLGAEKLNSFSAYFSKELGRKITVEYLLGKGPELSRQNELAVSVPTVLHDDADQGELSEDVKNMAAALAIALQQQKKPEQPPLPELEEAREILDRLDADKLNAALLMLRGLAGKQ